MVPVVSTGIVNNRLYQYMYSIVGTGYIRTLLYDNRVLTINVSLGRLYIQVSSLNLDMYISKVIDTLQNSYIIVIYPIYKILDKVCISLISVIGKLCMLVSSCSTLVKYVSDLLRVGTAQSAPAERRQQRQQQQFNRAQRRKLPFAAASAWALVFVSFDTTLLSRSVFHATFSCFLP